MHTISLTMDVETDWGGRYPVTDEHCRGVEKGMERFLEILDIFEVRCTLFVSAMLAAHYGPLIRRWADLGHEIASHGYDHAKNYSDFGKEQLSSQAERSKKALEDCTGKAVFGFRTPQLRYHPLLPEVLAGCGYRYDSSVARTSLPGRYRNQNIPAGPYRLGQILEIPVARIPLTPLPFGLLWINLLGPTALKMLFTLAPPPPESVSVFYSHPFDLVPRSWNTEFSLLVNGFYTFKAARVPGSLYALIKFFSRGDFDFLTMAEISDNIA